jgi:hypothetical protein
MSEPKNTALGVMRRFGYSRRATTAQCSDLLTMITSALLLTAMVLLVIFDTPSDSHSERE